MTVTFFGHKDTPATIQPYLEKVLEELILNRNANEFYVGNNGLFDSMVKTTLEKLKNKYSFIRYSVVLAYLPQNKQGDYSDTIYPEGLENVPMRFAICKRNDWMISKADIVITYVNYTFGGAYKYKEKSIKMGREIIELS